MLRYIVKRLIYLIPTLLIPLVIVFALVHIAPGDPALLILGGEATPEQLAAVREAMGFNESIVTQFFNWFGNLLRFDLGKSLFLNQPVAHLITGHLEVTMLLSLYAMIIAIGLGIFAGIVSAIYRNSILDQTAMFGAMVGISMPDFWFGLNLILLFSVGLGWFPVQGYVPLAEGLLPHLKSMVLPAITLGTIQAAFIARITRSSMLEVISEDYIRTAHAKGLPGKVVIYKHAFRNALVPILSVIGVSLAIIIGGSVVIESVFNLPGIGRLLLNAVSRRDYPLIQGVVLFIAVASILINLLVDIIYAYVDPRIKYD